MTNRPEQGDIAPSIKLSATDDQIIDLGRPSGTGHVVYFYPKDNTPGCTTESVAFSALLDEFKSYGFDVVGVSKDSMTSHENFRTKKDLTIHLASDPDGEACEAFGVWVEKKMYGKTFMGIERSTFVILGDGKIAKSWRKVRVKGHAEAVLELVQGL